MKTKFLLFSLVVVLFLSDTSAQILNGSFEDTTITQAQFNPNQMDTMPEHWCLSLPFGGRVVSDAFTGSRAVMLWSWYFGQSNGTLIYGKTCYYNDHPIAYRPQHLSGTYKFKMVNSDNGTSDSALVQVYLFKYNTTLHKRDTIGSGRSGLGPANNYTTFQIPITYINSSIPDSISIYFRSSLHQWTSCNADGNGNCNYLYLDNLALSLPTGIGENIEKVSAVFPNPTSSVITVHGDENKSHEYYLYNTMGTLFYSNTSKGSSTIDISGYKSGIYFLKIKNEQGMIETKKIIKE